MTIFRTLASFILVMTVLFCRQSLASTNNYAQLAQQTCQTLVAYRMGSLLDIQVSEVRPLAVAHKWLVTGEVKKQNPPVTFACLLRLKDDKMELEKLELFQIKPQHKP